MCDVWVPYEVAFPREGHCLLLHTAPIRHCEHSSVIAGPARNLLDEGMLNQVQHDVLVIADMIRNLLLGVRS